MYIKIKGADFSNVSIDKIELELSDITKNIVEVSGNQNLTYEQKLAIDTFISNIEGEIYDSIKYMFLPFIATDINKAFVNYKTNEDYGGNSLYQKDGIGIKAVNSSDTSQEVKQVQVINSGLNLNNMFCVTTAKGKGSSNGASLLCYDVAIQSRDYPQFLIASNGSGLDKIAKIFSVRESSEVTLQKQTSYSQAHLLEEIKTYGFQVKDSQANIIDASEILQTGNFIGNAIIDVNCYIKILPSLTYNGTLSSGGESQTLYSLIIGNGISEDNMKKLITEVDTLRSYFE